MSKHYLLLLLSIAPFISFSQEEKGCGIYQSFSVVRQESSSTTADGIFHCSGTYIIGNLEDSIFIELESDEIIIMNWSFKNEIMMGGYPSIIESPVEWYRNDSLIDQSELEIEDYFGNGPCGPQQKAGARLRTQALGSYQLRKTHFDVTLPVIVLYEKAAEVEIIEEVSLKIYPNPSSDVLFIEHGEVTNTEVILYSIDGKIIAYPTLDSSGGTTEIDTSKLSSGSYILTFSSDQHETVREKINIL